MDELWDIGRLSQYLGIKKSTLYAMIERKEIPFYRIGKLARFRPAEIDEWLLTKKQGRAGKTNQEGAQETGEPSLSRSSR